MYRVVKHQSCDTRQSHWSRMVTLIIWATDIHMDCYIHVLIFVEPSLYETIDILSANAQFVG